MGELPVGWVKEKLGNLNSDITYGYTAKSTRNEVGPRLLRITDIQDSKVDWSIVPFCEISNEQEEKYLLQDGDLVFARTGATVGKSFLIKGIIPKSVYASYLIRVRSNKHMCINFLSHFFKSPSYWNQIIEFSSGVGQPNVNGAKLKKLEVPIPPLNEQIRIANKLDSLLAKVEAAQTRLDKIPTLLKRFRQAVLAAATSGELTKEWEVDNLEKEYQEKTIGDLAEVQTGKTPLKSESSFYENGDVPWLTSAVTGEKLVTSSNKFVTRKAVEECKLKVFQPGTLLVAMYGEGKTRGQVTEINISATINQACAAVIANELLIENSFLKLCIESNYEKTRLMAEGGNQPNLNLSKVKAIPILLPTIEEQKQIVHQVESLFTLADKAEKQVQQARQRTDKLTQSLLAKAFKGELVPQNPNDEPAEKLLARIQVEREKLKPAKKSSRSL